MFQKYYKNTVKLSCMNKEKTVTVCCCCEKVNKVYKKKCKKCNTYMLIWIFSYNANNENLLVYFVTNIYPVYPVFYKTSTVHLYIKYTKNGQKHNLEQGMIYFTFKMIS